MTEYKTVLNADGTVTTSSESGRSATFSAAGGAVGAFEGTSMWHYAHSYGAITSPTANVSVGGLYSARMNKRLGLGAQTIYANPGYWMTDVSQVALGTNTGTWVATNRGLVVIDAVQNDMMINGTNAQALQGFTYALEALLWTLMSASRVEETNGAFVDTSGTWAPSSVAQSSAGAIKFSTSTTSIETITFTGTDAVLLMLGKDSAAGGAVGGVAQVKLDGATVGTYTLVDACKTSTQTTSALVHIPVAFTGLTNTSHTITVTNVGTAGTVIYLDCLLPQSTTPPTIIVLKTLYETGQYTASGSDAAVTLYNLTIDTLLAQSRFAGKPIYVVDPNTNFDIPSMLSSVVPRHLNDKGSSRYADNIVAKLATLPYRVGQNIGL